MAAPTGAGQWTLGTELILMSSGSTLTNGSIAECTSDDIQPADADGAEFALFEIDLAATPFSAAPTTRAEITIVEQRINSDGNKGPIPTATHLNWNIASILIKPSNASTNRYLSKVCPIHFLGAAYWLYWKDGGAGTASIASGWQVRATPIYFPPA